MRNESFKSLVSLVRVQDWEPLGQHSNSDLHYPMYCLIHTSKWLLDLAFENVALRRTISEGHPNQGSRESSVLEEFDISMSMILSLHWSRPKLQLMLGPPNPWHLYHPHPGPCHAINGDLNNGQINTASAVSHSTNLTVSPKFPGCLDFKKKIRYASNNWHEATNMALEFFIIFFAVKQVNIHCKLGGKR